MSDESVTRVTVVGATAGPRIHGRVVLVIGIVHAVLGLVLVLWPGPTLAVLAGLLGIALVAAGLLRILLAALDRSGDPRAVRVVVGLLGVAAGLLVMRAPLTSLAVLVGVVGVFWVLWGLAEAFVALTPEAREQRTPLLVEAGLVGAAGLVLLAWPGTTLSVVTVLAGSLMILMGLVEAWVGWRLHREAAEAATS